MKRTKAWQKKMDELSAKEKALKEELEFKSDKLEKRGLIVLGVAAVVAIGLIIIYSSSSNKKKTKKVNKSGEKIKVEAKTGTSNKIGSFITEKLVVTAITFLIDKFQKQATTNKKGEADS